MIKEIKTKEMSNNDCLYKGNVKGRVESFNAYSSILLFFNS
jgi:hypothetical protein